MKRLCVLFFLLSGCAGLNVNDNNSFSHDVELVLKSQALSSSVQEIQSKAHFSKKHKSADITIKDVALEDFVKVVFSEILKIPHVLSRDIVAMNKRVDVLIPASCASYSLFSVVVAILEKNGVEIEDVEGVLVLSVRQSFDSKRGGALQGDSGSSAVKVLADCIYSFRPVFSRAVDIQKALLPLINSENAQVIVHENTNTLIFKTSQREKRSIFKLLRILDHKQKQVSIDVTVAEVSMTDDLSYGLEGFLNSSLLGVKIAPVSSIGYGLTSSIFISDWLKLIVNMGEKKGLIKVKANPYLLISDGSVSSITIGNEYPVLTQQKSSGNSSDIINSIEYRKTGIVLNITPVISGDDVHLDSTIELSEGQKNDLTTIQSPAILTRKVKSSVVVPSGQSLIVGGLISESVNKTDSFLPFVRFRGDGVQIGQNDSVSRSELVIILNVLIVDEKNVGDWFKYLSDKYDHHEIGVK